ncbi:hypothetical protein DVH05_012560 [Phytophthora capsici]|nr:hypothetical protein DVH05_012560 [Phytophthora capsici]
MRLLFWTLLVGLATSGVQPIAALSKVADTSETSTLDHGQSTIIEGTARHLRLAPHEDTSITDVLVERGLKVHDEERGNFAAAAGWTANKAFNGLGKIVGHDNSNKLKTKVAEFFFSILRKKGKTAGDIFAHARKQTDPSQRAKFETVATMYQQYLTKVL